MTNLVFKALASESADLAFGLREPDGGNDLVFREPLDTSHPVDLRFGDAGGSKPASYGSLAASVGVRAAMVGSQHQVALAVLAATLAPVAMTAEGLAEASRTLPLSGTAGGGWQGAAGHTVSAAADWAQAGPAQAPALTVWQEGQREAGRAAVGWQDAARVAGGAAPAWGRGDAASAAAATGWHEAARARSTVAGAWEEAADGPVALTAHGWQELTKLATASLSTWGAAQGRRVGLASTWAEGRRTDLGGVYPWNMGRKPDPGVSVRPVDPPDPPRHVCYTPPAGGAVVIEFRELAAPDDTRLKFVCGDKRGPVVVPVRSTYTVKNEVTLLRVSDGAVVPCDGATLAIDADSWTWGFSAALPLSAQSLLGPEEALELRINGAAYRVTAETISRTRGEFGRGSLQITGRGRAAELASPAAPVLSFRNSAERTAQQVLADVLTVNGVPLGWAIDWRLTDWTLPAGAWSFQGSYIDAVLDLVTAAGGYVQPHPTDEVLVVRHRYPAAPWAWAGLTPDFVLPPDVVTQEGIEWITRPAYDRVFVSGTAAGVLGDVKRAGTGGANVAPMVTHAAITAEAAARQRGRAVLSDTGRQAHVALRLPVLAETGVILPGAVVDYFDGDETRRGLVRATSVSANFPEVWQSLKVETHV